MTMLYSNLCYNELCCIGLHCIYIIVYPIVYLWLKITVCGDLKF